MISSVPYVPPDTMKNVAATSGQSVSLATLLFAVGIALEGYRAGSDMELNFYSRPPKGISLARCGEASSHLQNTRAATACKKKMHLHKNIFAAPERAPAPSASSPAVRSALLPVSSSAPSIRRGCDKLRRLLQALINRPRGDCE